MGRIIIYDNKNILIADLDRTETKREPQHIEVAGSEKHIHTIYNKEYAAIFNEFKIVQSSAVKKQLRKIEKILQNNRKNKNRRKYKNKG